jgi:hypothetical protein
MARGKGGAQKPAKVSASGSRNNGKAEKKRPKVFDQVKRRLVVKTS